MASVSPHLNAGKALAEPRWVVVVTQTNRERWAQENIARQGFAHYFPKTVEVVRRRGGPRECRIRPLFPRYGFVEIVDRWRVLLGTFGVVGVVMNGESPAYMPPKVLDVLRARETQDGVVSLPQIREGQRVRIRGGLFSGQTGLYAGQRAQDRSKILIAYLGRVIPVLIDKSYLEAA